MVEFQYAKEVFDPFVGPIDEATGKHSGLMVDRTENAKEDVIDLDFWHPSDERWFRYSTMMRDVFEFDDGTNTGFGGGQHPERSAAAKFYPTKARFVERCTGLILAETPIDKVKVVNRIVPKIMPQQYRNRKQKRAAEKDVTKKRKKLTKVLDKREKGKVVKDP